MYGLPANWAIEYIRNKIQKILGSFPGLDNREYENYKKLHWNVQFSFSKFLLLMYVIVI